MVVKQKKHKLIDPRALKEWSQQQKRQKKTIATLNGSFDLLHAGHLYIIHEAAKTADILIVGLNSDVSIQSYKGIDRPIIPLQYRLDMMAALEYVDFVTWFDETTPLNFLEKVQPNAHTNGSEYGKDCIEADTIRKYGGRLHLVELIDGLSTSNVIKKIKSL